MLSPAFLLLVRCLSIIQRGVVWKTQRIGRRCNVSESIGRSAAWVWPLQRRDRKRERRTYMLSVKLKHTCSQLVSRKLLELTEGKFVLAKRRARESLITSGLDSPSPGRRSNQHCHPRPMMSHNSTSTPKACRTPPTSSNSLLLRAKVQEHTSHRHLIKSPQEHDSRSIATPWAFVLSITTLLPPLANFPRCIEAQK
jgi:hypothetical protein